MVNNSFNINKTNNHLSPSLTEYKKGATTTVLGQEQPYGGVKSVDGVTILPSW